MKQVCVNISLREEYSLCISFISHHTTYIHVYIICQVNGNCSLQISIHYSFCYLMLLQIHFYPMYPSIVDSNKKTHPLLD